MSPDPTYRALAANLMSYGASEVASKASRLLVVIVVARTLDLAEVGVAAAAMAAADILKSLTENGVGQRIIAARDRDDHQQAGRLGGHFGRPVGHQIGREGTIGGIGGQWTNLSQTEWSRGTPGRAALSRAPPGRRAVHSRRNTSERIGCGASFPWTGPARSRRVLKNEKNEAAQGMGKTLGALSTLLLCAACTGYDIPDNLEAVSQGTAYQAQWRAPDVSRAEAGFLRSETMNAQGCLPPGGVDGRGKGSAIAAQALAGERLTRNDLVDLGIGDDETFNGAYVISRDGTLKLPFLTPIPAQGRSTDQIEADIIRQLLDQGFYTEPPRVSVRAADFASVTVGVSGAVFEPRAVEIGGTSGDMMDTRRQGALGASTEARNLSAALRAAGGVRPDADISAVQVRRGGQVYRLDMRGVFEGRNAVDIMLLTGDEVMVPSRQCFQDDLMRPSPISPPGVSLFLSNLTEPANNNASSAVGQSVREVPYGTRYLQAVVDANCVGGPRSTSADRSAVLFTRNPVTEVSAVIERDIEDLVRRKDRDDYDPYLLPGDALACYDSTITNIAEIARVLGIIGIAAALQ
jgi:protein involved in polysaccharide export with SLBB domain